MSTPRKHKDGRCKWCNKAKKEHTAVHKGCPEGRKHRTFGYLTFSRTHVYTPKSVGGVKYSTETKP